MTNIVLALHYCHWIVSVQHLFRPSCNWPDNLTLKAMVKDPEWGGVVQELRAFTYWVIRGSHQLPISQWANHTIWYQIRLRQPVTLPKQYTARLSQSDVESAFMFFWDWSISNLKRTLTLNKQLSLIYKVIRSMPRIQNALSLKVARFFLHFRSYFWSIQFIFRKYSYVSICHHQRIKRR